jgi:hypothetical protein
VICTEESDDQLYGPRSMKAQIKQYMPYMPLKMIDKMLKAP